VNVILVLVVVLVFVGMAALVSYQGLVAALRPVDAAWAELLTQLGRRHELATELVRAPGPRDDEERAAADAITAACVAAQATDDVAARAAAETELGKRLDAYAALRAGRGRRDEAAAQLQQRLAALENDIHVARAIYDACARTYTTRCLLYPSRYVATYFTFPQRPPFELPERALLPLGG